MQARNAESVLPDPVGAEISVVRPARMCGQPCSCGSVGVAKRRTNHSATSGWAQARDAGTSSGGSCAGVGESAFAFVAESSEVELSCDTKAIVAPSGDVRKYFAIGTSDKSIMRLILSDKTLDTDVDTDKLCTGGNVLLSVICSGHLNGHIPG